MVQSVTSPDGTVHNFPDEATPEMIAGALGVQPPSPDFMGRMQEDYSKRVANAQESRDAYNAGKQSAASTAYQMFGQGAGMTMDTLENLAGSGIRSVYDASVDPRSNADFVQAKNYVMKQIGASDKPSEEPTWIDRGVDYMKNNYPVTTRNIEATGNILGAVPLVGQVESAGLKGADALYNKGKDAFQARKFNAVQDVVLPKQTPGEIADTALQRTTGGLFNKQIYTPNPQEKDMIQTALDAGVKPGAPLETNIQTLNTAKNAEAQRLKFELDKANVAIQPSTLNQAGVQIAQKIAANPLIDENSATVTKILKTAQDAIDSNPKTAAGVLQARKDFDKAITEFQPSALDTEASAKAFSYTAKQVRQGMNGVIADAVPDAAVRASLMKQSHMYDAIDNMAGKLYRQPTSGPARFFAKPVGKALKYGAVATGGAGAAKAIVGGHNAPQVNYYGGDE